MPDDAAMISEAVGGQSKPTHPDLTIDTMTQPLSQRTDMPEAGETGFATPDATAFADYLIDAAQRNILFWDALRQRANNMLEHERQGLPPLLKFKYETVADAAEYDPPAN